MRLEKSSRRLYQRTVKIKSSIGLVMRLVLCIVILLCEGQCITFQQLAVTADSYIINTVTRYTILYDRTQQNYGVAINVNNYPISAGSNMTLTLPSAYSLNSATVGVSATVNNGMVQYPNITITSNTVNIFGLFTAQTIVYNVTLILTNILNPSPAITTEAFSGTIGSDYAQPINLQSVVVLQPAQFESCYMTFNPYYVNRTSAMIITIKTKTLTPYNGIIQIVFPSNTWSQGTSTSSTNYLPISSSMSCSNISTNIKPTIICNGTQNQNKITVSNMFTTDLPAESTISFQINNFLSPPTNKPADLIVISSMDSSGDQINICSEYISDIAPNVMPTAMITITNGGQPLTVNQQYTIRFMFQTVDVFAVSDYFQILFPTGSNFTFNSNLLTGGINLIKPTATYSNNLLRCYMNTALSVKIYSNPFTMYIATGTYTAPPSIQTTANFQISIMRNGYPMQVGYQSLTAVASMVSGEIVVMGTNVVNKVTTYTLNLTINDALSANGKIRAKFPLEVSLNAITASSCAQLAGTSLTTTPTCTVNTAANTIQLTNINSSTSTIPSQTLTITFTNITNPFSTAPTSTFQVRTFYHSTDSSLVAIGTVSGFTPKEAIIDASNILITSSSYVVLDQSVTYQLMYTVDNVVDLGGWFVMFVPKPIIVNTGVLASNCKRGINTATTTTTSCSLISQDGTGYTISFTTPLSSTSLTKGQSITLQLTTLITNPPSTSPVSTFKLYTYSSTGYLIAKIQSSLSIQMTVPTTLTAASYTRDSNLNYALTSYQFTIVQHAQMDVSSVVSIQFPPDIIPNVSSTCGMTLPYVNASLVCSLVNQNVLVVILPVTMAISGNTALTLTVSNVRNPTSFRSPGNFLIKTFTANQTYQYAQGSTSNIIANNIPSSFALITGDYAPRILDTDITLTVSFTPAYEAPAYLQLSIPSYFTIPTSLSCSQVANFNGTCQTISTYTIQITGQFTSTGTTTFQISGFHSTIRPPTSTQYIILSSFTSDNYQLDYSSNSIVFTLTCNLPCMTCDSVNTSLCLSCYNNNLITDRINYDNNTGTCYSQCPDGKYQDNVTLLCQNCDVNCATCQGLSTFCTTCNQSTTNIYLNVISTTSQQCVSQCQTMMYPDTTHTPPTCVTCQSPCKTCTLLTFCLTCLDTYYFWQNTCTRTCPINITVGDNTTGNCIVCNTNCLTCTITADTCTSCNSTLILYNNKCLTACVAPLIYRPEISTCGPCDAQCKTCSSIASNCTSCDPLSLYAYYFNSTCLQSCPDLYYENIGLCQLCSQLTMNCDYCFNQTYCDKCNLGFVFFNGQCLATTPIGYVNISGFAQPCSGDCATCVNVQSNCTSCKTLNLFGNVCQSTCPSGFISLSNQCTLCQSPCQTCSQNVNNCTACIPNLTPRVYYLQNTCGTSCPDFYYPDNGTSKCQPCQSPCMKCSDLVTCTSCVDNYFLYQQNTCLTACPSQFVGINKICQACLSPCQTCTNSTTTCLTCQSGYFYLASTNQCLLSCGNGLYKDYINQTCISCTPPCSTCTNTTNTCLSCLTGILYNNKCLTQCPTNMYNNTNICQSCPTVCSSCSSSTICLSCTSPYILYNNYCISKCPDTYAVITNNTCTKCSSTNCHKCYDNDVCYSCDSDYSVLNGACLSTCPSGYKTNGTNCIQILTSSLSSSANMFPVPMSIATAIILVACMMSKLQNHRTFLPGAVYSLVGIIQTLALIYYIYLYYANDFYPAYPIGMYIALASLALLYLLNLLSIIQSILLCQDKRFCTWRDNSFLNKLYNMFSTFISLCISHKFKNLMFSRLFAFHIFSAPLDDVKKFKIFNIYSFISLANSGGSIFSVITIIKLVDVKTQFFYACLDVLIVVGLNVVLAFFNAFKGSDFFDQTTPEGYLLGKKMYADEDSFNAKISVGGNDMQNEQGQGYYSKINHTLASNQAFKFKQSDQSRQDINSQQYSDNLTHVVEKQYEDISVQAYDILEQKQPTQKNRVNFSTLKIQHNNLPEQSKYTTIFSNFNQDKSIQNTIDYDGKQKKSTEGYDACKRVDYSVQKYSDVGYVDRSMQGTIEQCRLVDRSVQGTIEQNLLQQSIQGTLQERGGRNDFSVQFCNDDVKHQKDVSIQGSIDLTKRKNDASVQGTIENHVDQSGQYSRLQSQKGVQRTLQVNDHSVQQTINQRQWNGQNTIEMKSISIQKYVNANDNISHYQSEESLEHQNELEQEDEMIEQQDETIEQQNDNDETILKKASENIFYIDQDMQDEIDEVGDGCLAQKRVQENKKTLVLRQQEVPQQKQDDFDLPADEIVQYQEELEQKILAKQKELERVRKEIQIKEKEQMLKEKLMREQRERVENQKVKQKVTQNEKEKEEKKQEEKEEKQKQKEEERQRQRQREKQIQMQMQMWQQKQRQKQIQKQREEREKQKERQREREKELQMQKQKQKEVDQKQQEEEQMNHPQQHQQPQQYMNTIIHQLDQTTSIDHSQVSPPIISPPHIDQHPITVRITPHQVANIQQMKQQKLQKQQRIEHIDDKTQTQLDEQEVFLNEGEVMVKRKRNNFQADMNVDIKEKGQENNEEKWRGKDDGDDQQGGQERSVRTKAKNTRRNNRRQPFMNAQPIQNTQQIEIQSTSRQQHQSMILSKQSSQPLDNIIPPTTPMKKQHNYISTKQPGKIRTIIDELKSNSREQLQQQQAHYEQEQQEEIDVIQMEDDSDGDGDMGNENDGEEVNQRRGNFIYQEQNGELKEQDEIDFRATVNINNNSNTNTTPNPINTIANKSTPLSDHYLPQQHISYHDQSLHQQQFDSSQDIPFNYKSIQNKKVKKNTQSDVEDYYHHQHNNGRRDQQQQQQHIMSNKNIALNQQKQVELTRKQSQLIKSLNNQSAQIRQLQDNSSKKRFIPQQPESHTQAMRVNIDKLRGYQYNSNRRGQQQQKVNTSSRSLLANNAEQNIVVGINRESAENQVLKRKLSSKNNPLYTKKKWQHNQGQRLNSIPQSSQANDSQVIQTRNNQQQSISQHKLPPHPPTQTDKQQTSFSHLGQKVAAQNNKDKPSKSKSFNVEMKRGQSMRNVQSFGQQQQQDIKVHFEKQEEAPNQRNNIGQQRQRGSNERQSRIPMSRPTTTLTNNKNPKITRQFQSQQIFGINPVSDAQQNSQDQTEFNPSVSKRHKNNLIIDKMMDRPDNDDLYEYYNRASTHKGKSKKRKSSEKKQINVSKSREKNENEKNLQKIYLQKLNGSSSSQIPRSKSRGRY